MSESSRSGGARIFVTCDTSPLGAAALDAAAALARRLDAELAGLFVENSNLLRMAGLPFAREYALVSAVARRVETAELERALRGQAEAMRHELSRAARDLPWSFQVVRGALLESVLDAMREPDLAVFGRTGQFVVTPEMGVRESRSHARTGSMVQPIVVLYDESPASERALVVADMLAQLHRTGLLVLVIGADAVTNARLRGRAAAQFGDNRAGVRYQSLSARDSQAIRRAVEAHHAAALLWHGVRTSAERNALGVLVDTLKCPVILVT